MTIWNPDDDGFADLTSHDAFASGVPHNTFARLRKEDPAHWTDYTDGEGFWSITRYDDILELNRQTDLLSSARGIRMEDQSYEEYLARRTFQETDPPEHMKTRIKVARAFSKAVIAEFEQEIRDLCTEILDQALEHGTASMRPRPSRANCRCACWAASLARPKKICPGWSKRAMR